MGDFVGFLLILVTEIFCGGQVSLFESINFLTMANKKMMRQASLIEFYVVFEILVLFLL